MIIADCQNTALANAVGLPVTECACLLLEHGVIDARAVIGAQRSKP